MADAAKKRHYQHLYHQDHPRSKEQKQHDRDLSRFRRKKAKEEREHLNEEVCRLTWENQQLKARLKSKAKSLEDFEILKEQHALMVSLWSEQVAKWSADFMALTNPDWSQWKGNPFVQQCMQDPLKCKQAIHYDWAGFQSLLHEFAGLIEGTSYYGWEVDKLVFGPTQRRSEHPADLKLFTFLFWSKTAMEESLIAMILRPLHQRDVLGFVLGVAGAVGPSLKREIAMPTISEQVVLHDLFKKMADPQFPGAISAMDGTETRCRRGDPKPRGEGIPSLEQEEYSSKKKQHSLVWLLLVLLNGVILAYSPASWMHNDQQASNYYHFRDLFQNQMMGFFADAGFTPNPKRLLTFKHGHHERVAGYRPDSRPPNSKKTGQRLTQEQEARNTSLSQSRVIVENDFAHLKHWKVLSFLPVKGSNDYKVAVLNCLLDVLIPLTNRQMIARPLRSPTWMHPYWKQQQPSQ
jgi:hypothetical protein